MDNEFVNWLIGILPKINLGGVDLTLPVFGVGGLISLLGLIWLALQVAATFKTLAAPKAASKTDIEELKQLILDQTAPRSGEAVEAERQATKAIAAERTARAEPEAAREIASGDLKDGFAALKASARAKVAEAAQEWRDIGALAYDRDPQTALEAYREVVKLDGSDFWAWIYLSQLERRQAGDVPAAKAAAEAAAQAAQTDRDTSVALNELGDVAVKAGDLSAARAAFTESHEVLAKLAAANPSSAKAQRDVSVSLERLGDVAVKAGDLSAARAAFAESLELARTLAAANPGSAEAQRDVSISLEKLGDVAVEEGDLSAARAAFAKSLETRRTLAAANSGSAEAQRDVRISLERLGNVAVKEGDLSVARSAFAESFELARTLAAANPSSAEAQRDVIVSLAKLAGLTGEVSYWQQALPIVEALAADGRLAPADAWMLEDIRKNARDNPQ